MKIDFICRAALCAAVAVVCGCAEKGDLVLAERGRSAAYTIVLPAEPTPVLQYAAEELRDWTEKLAGVRLPIATNTTPAKAIYVGGKTEEGLGPDGFRVRVEGRSVRILGSSDKRGVLYGVYELLETYGGIGWFSSWHTVVPKADRFAVPETLDDRQVPAFAWREHFSFDANRHHEFDARIRKNNDWWWSGFPAKLGGNFSRCCKKLRGHSFYALIPPEKYYGAHPEWFSEVNGKRLKEKGQLCLTNPEMTRTAISNMLEMVRSDPGCDLVSISHNDWYNFCTCPKCKAVDDAEGSQAGTELRFVNACAEALEKEFPDMIVKISAYQYTRVPPKVTKPRRNVLVDFAPIETDYSKPIVESTEKETVEIRKNIQDWGRIASEQGLLVFDYVANFNHYVMPYPNIRSLQGNIRFYLDNKVRFLIEEDDHCGYHGDFTELKAWLCSKWMWNPDLDYDTLVDRFMKGYYGAAAPFVRQYLDELHDLSAKCGCKLGCMTNFKSEFVTDAFVERALGLWDRATEAVKDDPACAYNVRMGRMSVVYLLLIRQGLRVSVQSREYPDARIRAHAKWMLESVEIAKKAGRPVSFAEGGYRPSGYDEKTIARWKRLADPKLATPPRSRAVVEIEDIFDVWGGYETKLVDDPAASGGKAYRMPNRFADTWIVYMPVSVLGYDPDADYRYRIRVKAERKPGAPDGNLVASGPGDRRAVTHKASEADGEYVWLDFGTFRPNPDETLFIAPGHFDKKKLNANPAYEYLWFDQIEFEKVETRAIQARIDAAAAAGGGRVSLAAGDHPVGSLILRSGVELHLEKGARLVGGCNPDEYELDLSSYGLDKSVTRRWSNAMIRIFNAHDVAVTGEAGSEICGRNCYDAKGEEGFRGPHAITAYGVTNLVLRGYTVRDAGNFGIYAQGCANVTARDVEVHGGHDAFDFFGCADVLVENCRIFSGDDCVAGHGNRNLTVRGCTVNSACSYFRLGGNNILVENCRGSGPAENPHRWSLTLAEKRQETTPAGAGRRTTLSVFTFFTGRKTPRNAAGIVFRNCRFSGVERLMHYNLSGNEKWQQGKGLEDVTFENVTADGLSVPLVAWGLPETTLKLKAKDCRFAFASPVDEFVRGGYLEELDLEDVTVEGVKGPAVRNWKGAAPEMDFEDVKGLEPACKPATAPFTCRTI